MDEDDIYDVARLHLESWKATYRDILPKETLCRLTLHEFIENWHTIIRAAERLNRIYCNEDGIQGYISYKHRLENDHHLGEIIGIYVAPESWGQGIGRRLIAHALERMRTQKCDMAYVWTIVENRRAREFYERVGFRCTDATRTVDKYAYTIQEIQYITIFNQ